ncbi:MAG: sigma-54 dependent transcriptional regulator [Candidatus Marithrix sp.]
MANLPSLLLVDDDPLISESLAFVLKDSFNVHIVATREEVKRLLYTIPVLPDLALVDLGLPPNPHSPKEGFTLVSELLTFNPSIKILILSGQDAIENVRHALTLGAVDFIPKPCDMELLKARLKHQNMILEAEQKLKTEKPQQKECGLIGQSTAMETLRTQIKQFANSPFSVLVLGESGTGKELIAQCLHKQSQRADNSCLIVNCAAFTTELLEAQLFGHAKGAFTGATTARSGFFEEADKGSLILDEIGEMPLALQSKLLRVLENGEYYRLGETKVRKSEARIIAASNRDLREEVMKGDFRGDLYHRLSVLAIKVPSLSERDDDDKLLLLEHFKNFYAEMGTLFQLDEDAEQSWKAYTFPGNVRELRNIVIRLGAKYPNQAIKKETLLEELETNFTATQLDDIDYEQAISRQLNNTGFSLDEVLLDWEHRYINAALKISDGNLSQAARILGINRTTLYSKMQRLSKINS